MMNCVFVKKRYFQRWKKFLIGNVAEGGPTSLKAGTKITKAYLHELPREKWFEIRVRDDRSSSTLRSRSAMQYKESAQRTR